MKGILAGIPLTYRCGLWRYAALFTDNNMEPLYVVDSENRTFQTDCEDKDV